MGELLMVGTVILGVGVGVGVLVGTIIWYAIDGAHSVYQWLRPS